MDLILIHMARALRVELTNRNPLKSQTFLYMVHTQCKSEWLCIAFENETDMGTRAHRRWVGINGQKLAKSGA